jgi:CRP-like cAMP-binding protein
MSASSVFTSKPRSGNLLLSTLNDEEYQAIAPRLQTVSLSLKQKLQVRDEAPQYVYFPSTAVVSVLAFMANGSAVEVGTIGNEGFLGIEILIGGEVATETTICQITGESLRMDVEDFREAIAGDTPLRRISQNYMLAYVSMMAQSVACNRLHSIEERFARWILMTHDRVQGDQFDLTQEFISDMLGVHRPSVSLVASTFQQAGYIRYTRGHMSILNRPGLEDVTCECYGTVSKQFERLLGLKRG